MSESQVEEQGMSETGEQGSSIEFTLYSTVIRLDVKSVEITQAQVVETLRECLCVGAPSELRERILSHIKTTVCGSQDRRA